MTSTKQISHPLQRKGTHQRERLLKSLIPAGLQLDDRDISDLLAFVAKLAPEVSFIDLNGQPNGDWRNFWQKDLTVLLAVITAIDLEQIRTDYRTTELALVRELDRLEDTAGMPAPESDSVDTLLSQLIDQSFQLAKLILQICQDLPANHPFKSSVRQIVQDKLVRPFHRLIALKKGTITGDGAGSETDYVAFIGETPCQLAWGLDINALLCIDYEVPDADHREELWRIFLDFYKALAMILALANKAFQHSLHGRSDHPPHIALMIAFLQLFRYLQSDLNRQTERHLRYYYEEVLRLQYRREIPDKVHIVFEIAENLSRYMVKNGTLFLDGKDGLGKERLYELAEELVINKAALAEKKNLYFYQKDTFKIPVALAAADMEDGIKTPYKDGEKAWGLASGKYILDKISYYKSFGRKSAQFVTNQLFEKYLPNIAHSGLIIASNVLWMVRSSSRSIFLDIQLKDKSLLDWSKLDIFLSTTGNLLPVESDRIKVLENNTIQMGLDDQFPDLLPTTLHGFKFSSPIILLTPHSGINLGKLDIATSSISVSSSNITNLILQSGDTVYPPSGEIPLMGSSADTSISTLYIGLEELSYKETVKLDITGLDNIIPDNPNPEVLFARSSSSVKNQRIQAPIEGFKLTNYEPNSPYKFIHKTFHIPRGENGAIQIYKIPSESISLSYQTAPVAFADTQLYHFYPFNGIVAIRDRNNDETYFQPEFPVPSIDRSIGESADNSPGGQDADANMLLGFENLEPGQTLSILFKMAQGTGNPDHLAPEIVWSYLRDNQWVRFPQHFILRDETNGLGRTGIIKLQIPQDINNGNTLVLGEKDRTDLYWLQISCSEKPEELIFADALPLWQDIFVQAGTAVFKNNNNTLEHLEAGIPAGSISGLRFGDSNIKSALQPFESYGGRSSETDDINSYYRRISERLRHKNRAVTVWDYERILLEAFPEVAIAKCIPHTDSHNNIEMPGHVLMAVIPYPDKMIGAIRRFYPSLDAGDLVEINDFLSERNSYWVGRKGISHSCCCHDEITRYQTADAAKEKCSCEDEPRSLWVQNARFEPVRISVCVRFYQGKDIAFYRKQLNEDIKRFLAPWATDKGISLLFGTSLYKTELLRFLEYLDYVDVVTGIKIKHFPDKASAEDPFSTVTWEMPEVIEPFTPRSVLTTYLDLLNIDNPNVIDHDIHVIEEFDECACAACKDNDTGVLVDNPKYNDPTDLKLVEGIGVKVEKLMKKEGIDNWKQLSEATPDQIKKILRDGGVPYNYLVYSTWAEQAGLLHEGKWEAFEKRIKELKFGKDIKK